MRVIHLPRISTNLNTLIFIIIPKTLLFYILNRRCFGLRNKKFIPHNWRMLECTPAKNDVEYANHWKLLNWFFPTISQNAACPKTACCVMQSWLVQGARVEIPSRCTQRSSQSSAKHHTDCFSRVRLQSGKAADRGELFYMQISNHVIVSAQPSKSEISISPVAYLQICLGSVQRSQSVQCSVARWWFPPAHRTTHIPRARKSLHALLRCCVSLMSASRSVGRGSARVLTVFNS